MGKQKPKGYWTTERCSNEALKYETRSAFNKDSRGAYMSAQRNGWLDEICKHMDLLVKPAGYWTKERCLKEALNYTTRSAFQNGSPSAYQTALKNGLLDDVCPHMPKRNSRECYWTKERIQEIALQFSTRGEFSQARGDEYDDARNAYDAAIRLGILDDVCLHMEPSLHKVPRGYWDVKENVATEALKWTCRDHFERGSKGAFKAAKKYGWYDEVTQHFTQNRRDYWNYERCAAAAAKYTNRSAFNQNVPGAYNAARRNGWMDIICKHMKMELWTREHGMVYLYPINDVPNLVKLGICSDQRLNVRTTAVCRQIGNLDAVFAAKCEDVKVAERAMKDHGMHVKPSELEGWIKYRRRRQKLKNGEIDMRIDGITEMRWTLPDQFEEMLEIMRHHSVDGSVTLHKATPGSLKSVLLV